MPASHPSLLVWLATTVAAAILAYGGIAAVIGWLQERALAKPNARSSHTVPTPQGGGIAVMAAALLAAASALGFTASVPPGGMIVFSSDETSQTWGHSQTGVVAARHGLPVNDLRFITYLGGQFEKWTKGKEIT